MVVVLVLASLRLRMINRMIRRGMSRRILTMDMIMIKAITSMKLMIISIIDTRY